MKKVALLAMATALCLVVSALPLAAQMNNPVGSANSSGQANIQLDPAEYNAYTNATGSTDPAMRASALESFLKTYPNSKVTKEVLEVMVTAYQQAQQPQKSIDAANRLLAVDPYSLRALVTIAGLDRFLAVQKNPPDQALLDQAADAADKGLKAPKPSDMSAADFQKMQKDFKPIFEDAKGVDENNKKDYDGAIRDLTQALKDSSDAEANQANGLQDQFLLAQAYVSKTPPDTLKGAYYYARVSSLAPQATDIQKNAKYYYHKYHGKDDGFDEFQASAKAALFPADDLATKVTPAPSPTDIANQLVTSTPDLTTLALSDREFLLVNASQENADKIWATMQGKTQEVPGIVISATANSVQLAVSEDAQQSKTADLTINMTEPLKTVPAIGGQQSFIGTFTSYTKSPFMIILSDGKSTAKAAPVKHTPARRK